MQPDLAHLLAEALPGWEPQPSSSVVRLRAPGGRTHVSVHPNGEAYVFAPGVEVLVGRRPWDLEQPGEVKTLIEAVRREVDQVGRRAA